MPVGGVEKTVTFSSETPLTVRAWMALDPDFTRPWWEWNWADITSYVRWDPGVATVAGRRERDTASIVTAGTARATLNNSDGRFSRQNPLSPYYGQLTRFTPIRFAVDPGTGMSHRFFGHVNSWPKRWDRSGNDVTIPIVCRGPLHRVARSQRLRSALFRSVSGIAPNDYTPHEYWPGEDGTDATQIASAVGGSPATYLGTLNFASDSELTGSDPLPTMAAGASIEVLVREYTATDRWIFQWFVKVAAKPASMTTIFEASTAGSATTFRVVIDPLATAVIRLYLFDAAGSTLGTSEIELNGSNAAHPSEADFFGSWATIMVASSQASPSDPLAGWLGLSVTAEMPSSGGVEIGGTHGAITRARLYAGEGCSVGHWAIWTDPAFNPVSDASVNAAAMFGYSGEQAHERIARLCREENIPLRYNTVRTVRLGSQSSGKLITVLQDAAKAAQGVIYEYEFGLGFQAISERYNQPYALTLDIASGEVVNDLEPEDSDLRFRNQWTVSRRGGSSATYPPAGTLSVGELVYDGEDTFGVETDNQLPILAGWLTHTDGSNDDYWPNIAINLAKHPALIPSWTAMGYGQRIRVQNLMSQAGVSEIDAIVEGHAEKWNSKQWSVVLNTSPASVYTIGTTDHATRAKTQVSGCTLASGVAVGATTLTVNIAAGKPLFTTSPSNLSVRIGGEVMPVTSISGASSPQTIEVTRTVAKEHLASSPVRVHQAAVTAY